jgi:hypothetical protein
MQMIRQADALEDGLAGTQDVELLRCVSCGGSFPLWQEERDWYTSRSAESGRLWGPPKRCADCRALRRIHRAKESETSNA